MCIGCKAYCALNAPSAPAGLGLYWIVSNIYQIMQQMFINIFVLKKHSDRKKQTENGDSKLCRTDTP